MLKKIIEKNICENILEEFFNSDIQESKFFLEEIFKNIEYVKKNKEKKEFIGNSFELIFSKKNVKIINQFNNNNCEISLKKFENKIKKHGKTQF